MSDINCCIQEAFSSFVVLIANIILNIFHEIFRFSLVLFLVFYVEYCIFEFWNAATNGDIFSSDVDPDEDGPSSKKLRKKKSDIKPKVKKSRSKGKLKGSKASSTALSSAEADDDDDGPDSENAEDKKSTVGGQKSSSNRKKGAAKGGGGKLMKTK